jgi:hypothetical protein
MTGTFDFLATAADPLLGDPLDGGRLVQRWAWFSLDVPPYDPETAPTGFNGNLFDPDTADITVYGLHYEGLTAGLPALDYAELGLVRWPVPPVGRPLAPTETVTLPVTVVILTLFLTLPVSESVLMWGAAPVLGVPLVLLFNTINLDPVVALAGMSVIWPLGDALPPTAIIGRLTVDVVGAKEQYGKFLKQCIVPAIFICILGTLMVIYSKELGFMTGIN